LTPVEKEDWRNEEMRPAILRKRVPAKLSQAAFDGYQALLDERKQLRRSPPKAVASALCVTEVPSPREMHVLLRGNPHAPGERIEGWKDGRVEEGAGRSGTSTLPSLHPSTRSDPYACAWSLKRLHRLLMLSSAYQMSSRAEPKALAKDPENDLFWRFNMRRLE